LAGQHTGSLTPDGDNARAGVSCSMSNKKLQTALLGEKTGERCMTRMMQRLQI